MKVRQTTSDRTRARLVRAARRLLSARGGIGAFTVDAVAAGAGVSRMTVYHQFGSKSGLIEAVFDSLAIVRTGVPRLVAALALPDPLETLATFVQTFAEVWQEDRLVIRRLQGLAAVDMDFSRVWHRREERRREGLRLIVKRAVSLRGHTPRRSRIDLLTDTLFAVISFETFDAAAGPSRTFERVVPAIYSLGLSALDRYE